MFAYIRGILMQTTPMHVVVETQNIGYKISIPASIYAELPQIGEPIILHLSFVVRELSQTLYGFFSEQERDLFEVLMNVSGIGPKTALSLIGHLSTHHLYEAISGEDIATICKVPGIGKKTAERLMIELRDKLPTLFKDKYPSHTIVSPQDPRTKTVQDAMSALIHLGYNQATAQKAIKKTLQAVPHSIDLTELITLSLRHV